MKNTAKRLPKRRAFGCNFNLTHLFESRHIFRVRRDEHIVEEEHLIYSVCLDEARKIDVHLSRVYDIDGLVVVAKPRHKCICVALFYNYDAAVARRVGGYLRYSVIAAEEGKILVRGFNFRVYDLDLVVAAECRVSVGSNGLGVGLWNEIFDIVGMLFNRRALRRPVKRAEERGEFAGLEVLMSTGVNPAVFANALYA